jgi:hypothetical protein
MLNNGQKVTSISEHEHWADYAELGPDHFAPHTPSKAELNAAAFLVVGGLLVTWIVIGLGVYGVWKLWH